MIWSVVVSVIAGFILLVAITFAIPSKTGVQGQFTYITTYIWQTSMGTHWAEVLLFIVVLRAVLLPDGVRHLGLADAVRVLARPGRAGPSGVALGLPSSRPGLGVRSASGSLGFVLLIPTWWNNLAGYYVGTSVGTTGLYIAFILPGDPSLPGGRKLRAGRVEPRQALQVDQHDRDPLGRLHLDRLHAPDGTGRDTVEHGLDLERRQLRTGHDRRRVPALRRLVGAVGQQVVQGPGADGHRRGARSSSRRGRRASSCSRPTPSSKGHSSKTSREGAFRALLAAPAILDQAAKQAGRELATVR